MKPWSTRRTGGGGGGDHIKSSGGGVPSGGGSSHLVPPPPLEWKFGQVFGERAAGEEVQEVDIISAIEFDKSGEHLATGDRGGRVVLFERVDGRDERSRRQYERMDQSARTIEYRYSTEFQSHEPEFDYLKSLEIEEKINKIRWCYTANGARFLLSTNDKTIKLWKVFERKVKFVTNFNVEPTKVVASNGLLGGSPLGSPRAPRMNGSLSPLARRPSQVLEGVTIPRGGFPNLRLPSIEWRNETALVARCRRVFANAHAYHINSISNNSDLETYISADDLRINLWNLEVSDQSFNIVDIKPVNMEDLTEVITSAEFHPGHCNVLAYSSSKGTIRLIDLRQSALCDRHAKLFEEQEPPGNRSFFSEIIASISDIKFSKAGRHILSRDYMTLKLWDLNMESAPVATFRVHEHLRAKLCDLYENDSIFDKFECCLSGNGDRVSTGSYSNLFRVFGTVPGSVEASTLEASKTPNRRQVYVPGRQGRMSGVGGRSRQQRRAANAEGVGPDGGIGTNDFTSKLLHLAWHPSANLVACAASNSLYMYYA
ncbi:hypothetical protein CBR_g31132 [Chara braunii]|uniref:Serine/threonine-protein phosphatase 2A 55 kDa regulatory subunit B n=1 Tax=Chara braunii TaxID=69332 RepID=A0A388LEM7_CHABU|nr:hypothetical protein CBR_g31132 [Chara braunii]|eukprot:GBG80673.1 hypothetical protein CBR_g31132 [Chara braunii]